MSTDSPSESFTVSLKKKFNALSANADSFLFQKRSLLFFTKSAAWAFFGTAIAIGIIYLSHLKINTAFPIALLIGFTLIGALGSWTSGSNDLEEDTPLAAIPTPLKHHSDPYIISGKRVVLPDSKQPVITELEDPEHSDEFDEPEAGDPNTSSTPSPTAEASLP